MKISLLKIYTIICAVCLAEFFLVPLALLPLFLAIPSDLYHVQVEPFLPAVFFSIVLGLLLWRKRSEFKLREKLDRKLLAIHLVIFPVFIIYLFWLSSIFPFQPLDSDSFFVKAAQKINTLSGPFTFRYRVLIYALFTLSLVSLLESLVAITRSFRKLYWIALSAGILFGEYFFNRIANHLFWNFMMESVGLALYGVFKLFYPNCTVHGAMPDGIPFVGTCKFDVAIAAPCAGLEGIALFLIVLATVLWMDRGLYRKRSAFLFGILGVIFMYFLNIIRIFSLILIGHYYDPKFAVNFWHAYSGIFFYAVAIFSIFKWGYPRIVK